MYERRTISSKSDQDFVYLCIHQEVVRVRCVHTHVGNAVYGLGEGLHLHAGGRI